MDLYILLQRWVDPSRLAADSVLFLAAYLTIADLERIHRLDDDASGDLLSILSYWEGKYDAATTEPERADVLSEMFMRIAAGYNAAAAGTLAQADFMGFVRP